MSRYFVAGGYTHSNPGDQAILLSTLERIRRVRPDARFVLWRQDRKFIVDSGLPFDVEYFEFKPLPFLEGVSDPWTGKLRSVYRRLFPLSARFFYLWHGMKAIAKIKSCDAVIFIGGGYLNSHYNLIEMEYLGELARRSGRPFYLLGQTLGPFTFKKDDLIAKTFIRNAARVVVRDEESAREAAAAGGNVSLGVDDAFGLENAAPSPRHEGEYLLILNLIGKSEPGFFKATTDALNAVADRVAPRRMRVLFVPMETSQYRDDREEGGEFAGVAPKRFDYEVSRQPMSVKEIWRLVATADAVLSMRFHLLVFAIAQGVPCVGLHRSPYYRKKIDGLFKPFGLGRCSVETTAIAGVAGRLEELERNKKNLGPEWIERAKRANERQEELYREIFSSR